MKFGGLICVFLVSSGCSVQGFRTVPDGLTTPTQLREGAAIAKAEAVALNEIADLQENAVQQFISSTQEVASQLGAPAILTGLAGGAAGFFVPTPGQRRREKVARAEAAVEKTVSHSSPASE